MEIVFQLSLVILLVLLNGYFVASEFSLVAVRKTRIDELVKKGNVAAKLVQNSLKELDSFISATQLGITIASLALGWIGEPAIARSLESLFKSLPINAAVISSHTLSVAIAFTIITVLHIVLGELAPKTIAMQRAEVTSLIIIAPLRFFTKIFWPFIWILNGAGGLVLKAFGFIPPSGHQLVHSEEEIKMILAQSAESGAIEHGEVAMVYSVFRFGDIPARQIMVPSEKIIAFNTTMSIKEIIKKVKYRTHSRFPIYEQTVDKIIGFIHIKDIFLGKKMIREIITVPETKRIDDILLDMRKKRVHIAIVKNKHGKTTGLVTLEDIIESLVGEIEDEFEQ